MESVDVPDLPHMDKEGLATFTALVQGSTHYLEYGCGGSTILATAVGVKTLISVDTSKEWLDAVQTKVEGTNAKVSLLHCDIGEVGEWGLPISKERVRSFHSYATLPWRHAVRANISPDLILVDGRFRVASFLFSLMKLGSARTFF